MRSDVLGFWVLLAACAGPLSGCSSNDDDGPFIEVPETFRATFVAGEVCMPSQIQTGTSSTDSPPTYSMTFTVCRHRCISFDLASVRIQQSFACYVGQCDMAALTLVTANRVPGEENCNALELVDPPPDECTDQTFEFNDLLEPPRFSDGEWIADDFTVTIPFFDIEQGEDVVSRIESGEPTQQVLMDYPQNNPNRKFVVNFDPNNAGPPYQMDCHDIPPP